MHISFKKILTAFILFTAPIAAMQRSPIQQGLVAWVVSVATDHHHVTHQGTTKMIYFTTPVLLIHLCTDHTGVYFRDIQTSVLYSSSCPSHLSRGCFLSTLQQAPAEVQPLKIIDFSFTKPQQSHACSVM